MDGETTSMKPGQLINQHKQLAMGKIKTTGTYKGKSNKLGGGGRFAQVAAKAGGGKKGAAIAAMVGRKKYGAKKMASMAAKGKKRASK